jgi:predicted DNA-binding transcriptional regulator YafY
VSYPRIRTKVAGRILDLADLLVARRYGLTRQQIASELSAHYPDWELNSASDRLLYRDLAVLRDLGRVENVVRPGGVDRAVYVHPQHAHLRREEVD